MWFHSIVMWKKMPRSNRKLYWWCISCDLKYAVKFETIKMKRNWFNIVESHKHRKQKWVHAHRKEMSLPHTPAADLPQICSRPAADSHLFHMQISFAADLPQTCRILFQYDEESAAGLPHTCRTPAAYSFSMMKSLLQTCRRLFIMNIHISYRPAADLPHTLSYPVRGNKVCM